MFIKKTKIYGLILTIILSSAVLSACTGDVKYDFPITKENLESELQTMQMDWTLDSTEEFAENHIAYLIKYNDISCSITTKGGNGERYISASTFFPKGLDTEQMEQFNEKEIPKLMKLLSGLYGEKSGKVFSKYSEYLNANKDNILASTWVYRKADSHYTARTIPWAEDITKYQINQISIANSIAVENSAKTMAQAWEDEDKRAGLGDTARLTISEVKKLMEGKGEIPDRFIVKGELKNIAAVSNFPATLEKQTDKSNYREGVLSENGEEISVIVFPTALTEKELTAKNEHYFITHREGEKTYFIIRISI